MHLGVLHASESAFLSELATLSVARVADLIVTCELSSREVVASCLEKIAEVNPTLNAVVRAGTSAAGMPIGIQIAAAPWREDLALAAAAIVERALGGWVPPAV